ncbi:LysE family translocator [Marinomonas sp. C2222]|uniref:LysE family translocator n=1 Tax=Marinomonas sargassi TaxID=2984494 RepID=A0ABT2YR82_9GAMM|nr:LysE family translocator [Marinomonas sargassi]MCV2402402.1 LysE family translocator [Marinomonas sargassi]
MTLDVWLIFSAAALVNIISPGPAILLAISNGVTHGMKSVTVSALGNVLGLFIISTVSMFGLGLLLQTSAILFTALKFLGAGYLIYLGIKKIRSSDTPLVIEEQPKNTGNLQYFKQCKEAFFIAITNPKAILFFVAFFPIFLDATAPLTPQFMIMTFTFMVMSFMSLITYGYLGKSVRHWFKKARFIRAFHRATGGIFIGFGLVLIQIKNA